MSVTVGYDVIHENIGHAPVGHQLAGYTTGSPQIAWAQADWQAHPHAVRICQDAGASDATADALDVERGAATNAEAAGWYGRARQSYAAARRPGQRWPTIYTSASNVTPLVNTMVSHGVRTGPHLWVANWNLTEPQAVADVINASGPFPVVGIQFQSLAFYDIDIFSVTWLDEVSALAGPHEHTTDGKTSLGQIASHRNMGLFDWLALQERLDKDGAAALIGPAVPPAGRVWRSVNP